MINKIIFTVTYFTISLVVISGCGDPAYYAPVSNYINKTDSLIFRNLLDSNGLQKFDVLSHCAGDGNGNIYSIFINSLVGDAQLNVRIDSFHFTVESQKLIHLTSFNMMSNNLKEIPKGIGTITSLQVVMLDFNKISNISDELYSLRNLEGFGVSDNLIDSVSSRVKNLLSLKRFLIDKNNLTSLPVEITQIPAFSDSITTSEILDVGYNKICFPSLKMDQFLSQYRADWKNTQACP